MTAAGSPFGESQISSGGDLGFLKAIGLGFCYALRIMMGISLGHFRDKSLKRNCGAAMRYFLFPLAAMLAATGCDQAPPAKAGKNPRVVVTKPITATVMDYQDFTGRLEAVKTIEIRSRVSGYVTEAPFQEGAVVKKDNLLFQID